MSGPPQEKKTCWNEKKEYFFESTGAVQKSGIGLDLYQTRILREMKENKNIGKSTGGVQKLVVEVGPDYH